MQPVDENDAQRTENLGVMNRNKVAQKRVALAERKTNIRHLTHKTSKTDDLDKLLNSRLRFGGGDVMISIDCAEDIDKYLRHIEVTYKVPEDFLTSVKSSITGRMRQILADWLFHVQTRFNLLNETLHLTINLLDRSLIALCDSINKENLQLLGVTCLFISSKFEEISVPSVEDFVQIAGGVFNKEDVFVMEQEVLRALDFDLGTPHAIQFLRRYRFYVEPDNRTYHFAKYICDVAAVCYDLSHLLPSTVAAIAIWLASYTFGRTLVSSYLFDDVFKLNQATLFSEAHSFIEHVINLADPGETRIYALREKYQEVVLDQFTDAHINKLNDFSDYGYDYSGFSSASTYSMRSVFEK
jgi:hypothetical protein